MRNNSKKYRMRRKASGEWSRIVRFNGRGYLMNSIYDRQKPAGTDDELWNAEHSIEGGEDRRRVSGRINEDFFDDFAEDIVSQ